MIELLIQYFKKGLVVAARKRKCLQNRIKVAIFQLMMNIPMEAPTMAELNEFTLPRYSGARNNESAPNVFMKEPFTVAKRINQNSSSAWYFLTCRNTSCTGKE
jgi:hypothetical protein